MARRKKQSGIDGFFHFLTGMPWWVGLVCAVLAYVFFRLIVPGVLTSVSAGQGASAESFAAALGPISIRLAPFAALFVLAIWVFAEVKKLVDRRRLDGQTGLDSVGELSWAEFEQLVAEAYRHKGYAVERTGDAGGDGGIDVVLRRDGATTLVQCKHWKAGKVGVSIVRELRGVMASRAAEQGIIVCYGTFTSEATAFARDNQIALIGGSDLVQLIRSVQKPRGRPKSPAATETATATAGTTAAATVAAAAAATTAAVPTPRSESPQVDDAPACPKCSSPMVKRTAKRGPSAGTSFWGCPRYPACQGVRAAN